MIVTTIDLLNYIRCRRYAPLDRVSQERRYEKQIVDDKFQEMLYISGLASYEKSIEPDDDETVRIDSTSASKELMNLALDQLHEVARQNLQIVFGSAEIHEKKVISFSFTPEITISSRLDFFSEEANYLLSMTILPITDKEFRNLKFTFDKNRRTFFSPDLDGIFHPEHESELMATKSNYEDKFRKLLDRHYSLGRHIYHLAFKAFILNKIYPNKDQKHILSVVNHQYVYDGQKDAFGPIYAADMLSYFDMTYLVEKMQPQIEIDLYRMINHIELDDDSRCLLVKNECCKNQSFECQFVDYCFSHLPEEHSILHYFFQHQGFVEKTPSQEIIHDTYDLINDGMVSMQDIPISWLHREKNLMQRYCIENEYTYFNKTKINAYLSTLRYPIYYLDFEAYPSILPRFKGESAYQQSVFQFSLHIQTDQKPIDLDNPHTHRQFLSQDDRDHRLELIQALLEAIPEDNGSIVVYNQTFEKNRLQELASLFPIYAQRLLDLSSRLFDLYKVIKNNPAFYQRQGFSKDEIDTYNFYAPSLDGSYSLKKVLPALCGVNYNHLVINNGESAYIHYARLSKMDEIERKQTIDNLYDYCQMDTYAMYLILEVLKSKN